MERPIRQEPARHSTRRLVARGGWALRGAGRLLLTGWSEGSDGPESRPAAQALPRAVTPDPTLTPGLLPGRRSSLPLRHPLTVLGLIATLAITPAAAQGRDAVTDRVMTRPAPSFVAQVLAARAAPTARPADPDTSHRDMAGPSTPVSAAGGRDPAFDRDATLRARLLARSTVPASPHRVIHYRAQPGEALWVIAQKFGISPMTVWWANRLVDKDTLKIGQLVRILPTTGIEHVVRDGDTLDAIARAYRADADAIAAYNGLDGGVVILGQRLIVPGGHGSGYDPVPGVSRSTAIPRLRPGQADRAVVDQPAVAAPVVQPLTPEAAPTGIKRTGGVAWPSDPTWIATTTLTGGILVDQGTGIALIPDRPPDGGGDGGGRPGTADGDGHGITIIIPDDAPIPRGHGAHDEGWPNGPPPGPRQGTILQIDDPRLTLTEAQVLADRPLLWPVFGGGRFTQNWHSEHNGIDIADLRGTPILAAASARVVYAGWRDERSGNAIYLKHGPRFFTSYLHMWRFDVKPGDWVRRGQVIGYMGSTGFSTGSHLHFAVTAGPLPGYPPDGRDPLEYLSLR
ncbi:MAG: peptidoglycan DD-metalloendopeptidase family protein [Chloroflexi bacterium]|nr:peptidoglycan DD-metalloendopeptidase family protein [Chloroflexota bacterium]